MGSEGALPTNASELSIPEYAYLRHCFLVLDEIIRQMRNERGAEGSKVDECRRARSTNRLKSMLLMNNQTTREFFRRLSDEGMAVKHETRSCNYWDATDNGVHLVSELRGAFDKLVTTYKSRSNVLK